jgi:AcrR family transcriptional regulator
VARTPRTSDSQTKRRAEIIAVSTELFSSAGYHQTSMDEIAERVGIAKPTLYHYYVGKAQILAAIHEEFVVAMSGRLRERAEEDLGPSEQLREVMADIFAFIEQRSGHVKMFYEHQQDLPEESRAHITKLRTAFTNQVTGLIQECIDAGDFRPVDPLMAARAMFGMCNWSYHWYRPSRSLSARATAEFMYELFVKGLRA